MVRWLVWTVFVLFWTAALELPIRTPENMPGNEIVTSYRYLIAKSLHVSVYVAFTVLTAWLPVPVRYRWLSMFFLMLHAWGSEMLQEVLQEYCNRGGSLTDVAFDVLGIAIGLALSWKLWTRE